MNYATVGGLTSAYESLKEKLVLLKGQLDEEILLADSADWSKATTLIDKLNEEIDTKKTEIKEKATSMKEIANEFGKA